MSYHYYDYYYFLFRLYRANFKITFSSVAGKKVTGGKVGKIVGLDPASPLFRFEDVNGRLAETDASYVEAIHTCAGMLGMSKPIGMASFYPNGGTAQPGCAMDVVGACAHGRAYEYYIESISRPHFYAIKCESFEKLTAGTCSAINEIVPMGGEPGNKKYVNSISDNYFSPLVIHSRIRLFYKL